MAEDITSYTFEFGREVRRLQQELGARLDKIVFAEVHVSSGDELSVDILRKMGHQPVGDEKLSKRFHEHFSASASSALLPLHGWVRRKGYAMIFNDEDRFPRLFGEENKQPLALFMLHHEVGHAIVRGGLRNTDENGRQYPFGECAADAYAALRLLQRFGDEAKPLLSMLSWMRAYLGMQKQMHHLTSPVLDVILNDSRTEDFSKLSADETAALAGRYARAMTPLGGAIAAASRTFDKNKGSSVTEMLASTCLSSETGDFAFYVAAKAAQPFLHQSEIMYRGKLWTSRAPELIEQVRAEIAARQPGLTLQGAFNGRKEPWALTLKVDMPPKQKQFVFAY